MRDTIGRLMGVENGDNVTSYRQVIYTMARRTGKSHLNTQLMKSFDGVGFLRPTALKVKEINDALGGKS